MLGKVLIWLINDFLGLKKLLGELGVLQVIEHTIRTDGKISEKRITKLFIIISMMTLTFIDALQAKTLRIEVLLAWFGLAGYDGYRMLQEKKMNKVDNSSIVEPVIESPGK